MILPTEQIRLQELRIGALKKELENIKTRLYRIIEGDYTSDSFDLGLYSTVSRSEYMTTEILKTINEINKLMDVVE